MHNFAGLCIDVCAVPMEVFVSIMVGIAIQDDISAARLRERRIIVLPMLLIIFLLA